jgi:serine/threonine-protein kinase
MTPDDFRARTAACPHRDVLAAFGLGRLTSSALPGVADHLASCRRCREALDSLTEQHALLASLRSPPALDPFFNEPEYLRMEAEARAIGLPPRPPQTPSGPLVLLPSVPQYAIEDRVGQGGHGVVYRARQREGNRLVAMKFLPAALGQDMERRQRFGRAVARAAGLSGSRVLPILEARTVENMFLLVTPYVAGSDLGRIIRERRLRRQGRLISDLHPLAALEDRAYLQRILEVLDRVIAAVAVIHAARGRYAELKPSNCLVEDGGVWLSDFGLSCLAGHGSLVLVGEFDATPPAWGNIPTALAVTVDAPALVSPEHWAGRPDTDRRTDVYRLGVTLYLALTLEWPYGPCGVRSSKVLPPPPSSHQPLLTPCLDALIHRALNPDRNCRYPSAQELQADWQRIRQDMVPLLPLPPTPRSWLRRMFGHS